MFIKSFQSPTIHPHITSLSSGNREVEIRKKRVQMLMKTSLDAVRINATFDKKLWIMLVEQLKCIAVNENVSVKYVAAKKTNKTNGLTVTISRGGHRLQISVLQCMKSRWISYSFNGTVPVALFETATLLLGKYSFANALLNGRVKRLELAIDYFGSSGSQYISHYRGVKTSAVVSNEAATGLSQYSGSRDGETQLVMYDKSQELLDKGKQPLYKKMLRVELRLQNRVVTIAELVEDIFNNDPWRKTFIVKKSEALKHPTTIQAWQIFLSTCSEMGVAKALQQFPEHKKSFLMALSTPSMQTRIPSMADFEKPLIQLLGQSFQVSPVKHDEAGSHQQMV